MQKQIIRREANSEHFERLNQLPNILRRIYAARAVKTLKEIDHDIKDLIAFDGLLGIDRAQEIIGEAIIKNQRIMIVGDFDADGATSTAVAIRALKLMGAATVDFLVPNRFAYGYGLTPELVEEAKKLSPDLLITVDNGIANHAGVQAAKACGMRVIITDHHLPAETLPNADAIVNPNQKGDNFPSKNLAGVGVIFYVMLAVRRYLINRDWFEARKQEIPNLSKLLDLVALGTIADLVPLDHNNRILVHHGLRRIRALQCVPGIVALLELAGRDLHRTVASDLGFAVAARLNAAGRMDDMSLGIACLLSDDAIEARTFARELNQLNLERRSVEQDMQTQALAVLSQLHLDSKGDLPKGLCLFDENWHQGVIGILASRIKDKFNRPVIVFAPGQGDELKGSGRSIDGLHIRDALALIHSQKPTLITKFGGHAMAAGLTIARHVLEDFVKIFDQVVSQQVTELQLQHCLLTDGSLECDELNLETATLIRNAGPWGQAFPEPLFDDTFIIIEQRIVGDKHLKLKLAKKDKILDAIWFFVDIEKWPNHRCQEVRAVYRLDINEFRGKRKVQLIIEYLEVLSVLS